MNARLMGTRGHLAMALLMVLAVASATEAQSGRRGGPANILNFEPIGSMELARTPESAGSARRLETSFFAFGRTFALQLEPNELFGRGAMDVWVDRAGKRRTAPRAMHYKGVIAGEPRSWVRVTITNGVLDGMLRTRDDVYFIEPGERFFAGPAPSPMVMYRLSDTISDWEQYSCAADASPARSGGTGLNDFNELVSELAATEATKNLELGIVADWEYFQEHGAASAEHMQTVINQIDGIYREAVGVAIQVTKTVVFSNSNDPFTSTTAHVTLLEQFTNYRASASSDVYNTDLAHLFTNRDLDGNVIGVAFLNVLCSRSRGTGLSQDFTSSNKSRVLLTAHELGHNFAAPHDNQSGSSCAFTPFGYIMNPYVSSTLNLEFSACSKGRMNTAIASASCLDGNVGPPPPPPPPPPTCTVSVSPLTRTVGANSDGGRFKVSAVSSCGWTVKSNASWITITSATSNNGTKRVNYKTTKNTSAAPRTGTVTVNGKTFALTQKGVD